MLFMGKFTISMVIFHSYFDSLPEAKPPFSYGFPMVFPFFHGFSYGFTPVSPIDTKS